MRLSIVLSQSEVQGEIAWNSLEPGVKQQLCQSRKPNEMLRWESNSGLDDAHRDTVDARRSVGGKRDFRSAGTAAFRAPNTECRRADGPGVSARLHEGDRSPGRCGR